MKVRQMDVTLSLLTGRLLSAARLARTVCSMCSAVFVALLAETLSVCRAFNGNLLFFFFYMHIIKAAELIEHIELFLHLMHFLEVIRGGSSCPKSFRSLLEACGCFQLLCRNTKTGSIHFFLTTKPEIELFSITWQRKQVETQRGEDSLLSVFSTLLWFKTGRGCRSSEVREPEVSHSDHQLHVAFVYLWAPVYLSLLSLARGNVMFCISLLSCLCLASCFPDKDVEILGSLSSKCSKQR